MKELRMNEMMEVNGGKKHRWSNGEDSITLNGDQGGMPWADWKRDKKGDIDITVYTPIGNIEIHDDVSNNLNLNKRDNSRGKYHY